MCAVKIDSLGAEMKRKKVSRLEIATYLGVSYRTIHSRFNGKVPWEYSECVRIRDHFFPRTHIRIPVRNRGREGVRENGPNEEDNIKPRLFTDQP